ncbi:MAG TPA: PP2C family protein-serine/threonine phosphatase [Flavobacteriales bacterium]|nr:PP2C family protein-serine/threonine phosphatase [Flavobacteriales bacterium]HQV76342.1 PP2C family protein-serine/threonine phosphatase [Flavobacteriales bacterium]HQW42046.1 PP2C family protein-serine/threonine phosphatase [Flavobacteriales bacterium]
MARLERIIERLDLKEFQLKALLDVTKAINNTEDREALLALYERIIREDLGITRLMLFERTNSWQRIMAFGNDLDSVVMDIDKAVGSFTDIQVIGSESTGSLGAFDVAVPVYHRGKALAFLLIGDIDEDEQGMSPTVKHLNFIQTLTNLIVVALENRRLAQQELAQVRSKRELELAAEMQSMLIPTDLPNTDLIDAAGWYQPHSEVGGDYYDLIELSNDRYVACVADVSGKGIAAALLMSNFQANLNALVPRATDLEQLVTELNAKVQANARGERFITLFIGLIDLRTRRMQYVNAGHNDPLLHHASGITPMREGCIALGMMPTLPFLRSGEVELPTNSTLLCYTDGLVEQENEAGLSFETAPVAKILNSMVNSSAKAINEALVSAFDRHRNGQPYLDDIAVLTCRFK